MASKHLYLTIALSVFITLILSTMLFHPFGDDEILGSSALDLEAARLLNQRFNAVSKLENLPDTLEPAEAGLLIHSTVYEGFPKPLTDNDDISGLHGWEFKVSSTMWAISCLNTALATAMGRSWWFEWPSWTEGKTPQMPFLYVIDAPAAELLPCAFAYDAMTVYRSHSGCGCMHLFEKKPKEFFWTISENLTALALGEPTTKVKYEGTCQEGDWYWCDQIPSSHLESAVNGSCSNEKRTPEREAMASICGTSLCAYRSYQMGALLKRQVDLYNFNQKADSMFSYQRYSEVVVPYHLFLSSIRAVLVPTVPSPSYGFFTTSPEVPLTEQQSRDYEDNMGDMRAEAYRKARMAAKLVSAHLERSIPILSFDAMSLSSPVGLMGPGGAHLPVG